MHLRGHRDAVPSQDLRRHSALCVSAGSPLGASFRLSYEDFPPESSRIRAVLWGDLASVGEGRMPDHTGSGRAVPAGGDTRCRCCT